MGSCRARLIILTTLVLYGVAIMEKSFNAHTGKNLEKISLVSAASKIGAALKGKNMFLEGAYSFL